jgi:hypothetical protein
MPFPLKPWFHAALLCAWLAPQTVLAANQVRITIFAGDFDRSECVVEVALPSGNRSPQLLLVDASGRTVPAQSTKGRLTFLEPSLRHGESRTYEIRPNPTSSKTLEMTANRAATSVQFNQGGRRLFDYQTAPGDVPVGVPEHFKHGAHLHPVFSPSGKLVTGNHPPDHRWHRGIWFSWTKTEFEGRHPDFWNMGKDNNGQLTGEIRFAKLVESWNGSVHAGVVAEHRHIDHTGGAAQDVLRETWELRAYRSSSTRNIIDLVSKQTCATDSPLKLPKYHYGGLGVRGNAAWDPKDKVAMLTSEGHDRKAGDSTTARWVWMGGDVDGGPTGLAILIHPDNFRFPQPLRLNPNNPQLCIAPSQGGDWEITPGKPYVSKYRFVVFDGKPDAKELDRLWNDYAHPPKVTVE